MISTVQECVVDGLDEVNRLLDWRAGTVLPDGRILGRLEATPGKRPKPGEIPDSRIAWLDSKIGLAGRSVLEVGCFEGIHTVGLRTYTERVTAVDVRPVNVIKTLTRLSWHKTSAAVFQQDAQTLNSDFGTFDAIFHCGTLYHLEHPAEHLLALGGMCRWLMLDTHVAREPERLERRQVAGMPYWGAARNEGGWKDPFSGTGASSFWLLYESLEALLGRAGFRSIEIRGWRSERNGARVCLLASKDAS
jgi:tRNA (mo5U34)-methyltransferase